MLRLTPPARRVVGVLAVTETISWGVLFYAFSVVLRPMAAELGAGRGALAGAWSLALVVAGAAAPPVGSAIDRGHGRAVMTAGAVLGPVGVSWWSAADSLAALYGAFAVIGVAGAMVLYEPAFAVVNRVVEAEVRSRALLVVTVVAGFAATIFLPLTAALEAALGWRATLRWLAVLLLATTVVPHALALPPRDAVPAADAGGPGGGRAAAGLREVLRQRPFWWLTAAFVLGTASITAVSAHLVAFLVDRGETTAFAAVAVGSLGAIKVGGRVVLALAERRRGMASLTALVFASQGAALALLALGRGRVVVVLFVLVYGAGFGAATIARPLLVAERWGTAAYGTVAGGVAAVVTLAKAVSPVVAGSARDALGSATPVLLGLGAVTAAAGLCLLPLVRAGAAAGDQPPAAGTPSSSRSPRTRRSISSRMGRTASAPLPAGSSRGQST